MRAWCEGVHECDVHDDVRVCMVRVCVCVCVCLCVCVCVCVCVENIFSNAFI